MSYYLQQWAKTRCQGLGQVYFCDPLVKILCILKTEKYLNLDRGLILFYRPDSEDDVDYIKNHDSGADDDDGNDDDDEDDDDDDKGN